jgi:hypothetical protein
MAVIFADGVIVYGRKNFEENSQPKLFSLVNTNLAWQTKLGLTAPLRDEESSLII